MPDAKPDGISGTDMTTQVGGFTNLRITKKPNTPLPIATNSAKQAAAEG
jgi:hypothetical protein